jgi:hypothetical protein
VVDGLQVLSKMEKCGSSSGSTNKAIIIADCGDVEDD